MYTEIIHAKPYLDDFIRVEGKSAATASRIKALIESGEDIHFIEGRLDEDLPQVSKDTQIRIGGGDWQICIPVRAGILRKNGFENVVPDRSISFCAADHLQEYIKNGGDGWSQRSS